MAVLSTLHGAVLFQLVSDAEALKNAGQSHADHGGADQYSTGFVQSKGWKAEHDIGQEADLETLLQKCTSSSAPQLKCGDRNKILSMHNNGYSDHKRLITGWNSATHYFKLDGKWYNHEVLEPRLELKQKPGYLARFYYCHDVNKALMEKCTQKDEQEKEPQDFRRMTSDFSGGSLVKSPSYIIKDNQDLNDEPDTIGDVRYWNFFKIWNFSIF